MKQDHLAHGAILIGQGLAIAGIWFGWELIVCGVLLTIGSAAHLDWSLRVKQDAEVLALMEAAEGVLDAAGDDDALGWQEAADKLEEAMRPLRARRIKEGTPCK